MERRFSPRAVYCSHQGKADGYYADFGSIAQLAKALEQTFVYDGIFSRHRKRIHGRPQGICRSIAFLVLSRITIRLATAPSATESATLPESIAQRLRQPWYCLARLCRCFSRGRNGHATSPFLYFADHLDPELARQVSEGRKREFFAFGWDPATIPDPENHASFERSKLKWDELPKPAHAAIAELVSRADPAATLHPIFEQRRTWKHSSHLQRGGAMALHGAGVGCDRLQPGVRLQTTAGYRRRQTDTCFAA